MASYTKKDNKLLVAYIAANTPTRQNRLGRKLYQQMVQNEDWAKDRSWSAWREHYKQNNAQLDRWIEKYQDRHKIPRGVSPPPSATRKRFTSKEDEHLVKFLAQMAPLKNQEKARAKFGRSGNHVYKILLDPEIYPWALSHTWHSWRERYVKNQERFDRQITQWQEANEIDPNVQIQVIYKAHAKDRNRDRREEETNEDDQSDHGRQQVEPETPTGRGVKRSRPKDNTQAEEVQSTHTNVRSSKKRKYAHLGGPGRSPTGDSDDPSYSMRDTLALHKASTDMMEQSIVNDEDVGMADRNDDEPPPDDITQRIANTSPVPEGVLDQVPAPPITAITSQPPLDIFSPPTRYAGSLQSTRHTPLSDTPRPLPRDDEWPSLDVDIEKTPQNVPETETRSQHPTPSPTKVQSAVSVSLREPHPPGPSAFAKSKQRNEPSPTLLRTPVSPPDVHSRSISGASNPRPTSSHSASIMFGQSLSPLAAPRRPLSRSPSLLSDGPFATSSPTPQMKETIHGIPEPRKGSFRNNDRVRTRKVIVRQRNRSHEDMQQRREVEVDQEKTTASWPRDEGQSKITGHRSPLKPGSSFPAYFPTTSEGSKPATSDNRSGPSARRVIDTPHAQAPTETRISAAAKSKPFYRNSTDIRTLLQPAVGVDDVFVTTPSMPLGSNQDKYVLGTSNPPNEPPIGTQSMSSWNQISTPVPMSRKLRDRSRRRTFAGLSLPHGLPDIDLLAELRAKRAKSRSPTVAWTRGSSDITILPKHERQLFTSSSLLSDTERAIARRGPSRKSVIPIVINPMNGSDVPFSLGQLSPSTSGIIFQEGLAAIFKRMEENHGFSGDIVRNVWVQQNMDLLATDKKLLRMRIGAEMAANNDEDNDPMQNSMSNLAKAKERVQKLEEYTRGSQHPVLAIEAVCSTDTDYTPPVRSRAGHYRRFLEQGRHWEARQREIQLASRLSVNGSPSTFTTPQPTKVPVWGKKEDEALRASSEDALRELARKFGDKVLRQKCLALLTNN